MGSCRSARSIFTVSDRFFLIFSISRYMKLYQVDSFTAQAFAGNPAGVCILEQPKEAQWMQQMAAEMNLSETAFLLKKADGSYHLRWFTPVAEVELCGHATLASAHILWEKGFLKSSEMARFRTLSGSLTAVKKGNWIEMDFPAEEEEPALISGTLTQALGVRPVHIGKNRMDYLIVVDSEYTVRHLQPNFSVLAQSPVRGFMVTAASGSPGIDFVSRFFAPALGINEDPVTGSAHCCLAPYWAKIFKKNSLTAFQASARGGLLRLQVQGERVLIAGQAVTVFEMAFVA